MIVFFDLLPDGQEIIDKLFPSGWQPFLVQLLAMIVLVLAFIYFLFKPVRKMLKARQDHIENNIRSAEEKNKVAEEYLLQAHDEVKNAAQKAQDIMLDIKKEAVDSHDELVKKTSDEIKLMKTEADEDIAASKIRAQAEIKQSIIDVAFHASKTILEREVDSDDNKRIVDDFLSSLDEDE